MQVTVGKDDATLEERVRRAPRQLLHPAIANSVQFSTVGRIQLCRVAQPAAQPAQWAGKDELHEEATVSLQGTTAVRSSAALSNAATQRPAACCT